MTQVKLSLECYLRSLHSYVECIGDIFLRLGILFMNKYTDESNRMMGSG